MTGDADDDPQGRPAGTPATALRARVLSFGFIAFLAAVMAGFVGEGLTYEYWSQFGPGPGFLPIWLGGGLAFCVLMLIVVQLRAPEELKTEPGGLSRVGAAILAMAVTAIAIPYVGMIPSLIVMIVVVLTAIEGRHWRSAILVSLGTAAVIYLIFDLWLGVQFPERYFWSGAAAVGPPGTAPA